MSLTGRPIVQKAPPVSKALRNAARGRECTLRLPGCLPGTETVVLAHLRRYSQAGMGGKPPDWCAVFACAACHSEMDLRTGSCGDDDILRALMETLRRQFEAGNLRTG